MGSSSISTAIVVGAGIFGVSSAVHLARLGIRTTLINDGQVANGASGRSLSWLNSSRMRSAEYHRLRMIGIDRHRTLATRYPNASWLQFDGGLTWDADNGANEIAAAYAHEKAIGYDALHLDAEKIPAITPGVDASRLASQGAIFNPGEGWVDLPSLIEVLLAEFLTLGGALVTDAGRASVTIEGNRATGVSTADGRRFAGDAVLLATGAAVPEMAAKAGCKIDDDTPVALLVKTKPYNLPLKAVLNTPDVAIRPTPTGALVLDSGWSEKEVIIHGEGQYEAKDSTIQRLLAEASRVLEGNPMLELDSFAMGPKPIPGDGEPVLGQIPGIAGYYLAFSHSGATLGLIVGELLADEMAHGSRSPLLATFRPERFA